MNGAIKKSTNKNVDDACCHSCCSDISGPAINLLFTQIKKVINLVLGLLKRLLTAKIHIYIKE